MSMKKQLFVLLAFFSLISCQNSGDGGGVGNPTVLSFPSGIYHGSYELSDHLPQVVEFVVTSDNQVRMLTRNLSAPYYESFFGTKNGTIITGTLYSTSIVDSSIKVTSVETSGVVHGTFTTPSDTATFFAFPETELYNRGAALSNLNGTWVDQLYTEKTGISTWVFQSDGSFTLTSVDGCNGSGAVSLIDPSKNEYDMYITITSCPGYEGTFSGIFYFDDTIFPDGNLNIVLHDDSMFHIHEPMK